MGVALVGVATGKVRYAQTLTSGTSYTVPAGVTSLNVTLTGGGGGGSNTCSAGTFHIGGLRGMPGQTVHSIVSTSPGASIGYAIGAGGGVSTQGGTTTFTGATSAAGGLGPSTGTQAAGYDNGGSGGVGTNSSTSAGGSSGGAGSIVIEYWA